MYLTFKNKLLVFWTYVWHFSYIIAHLKIQGWKICQWVNFKLEFLFLKGIHFLSWSFFFYFHIEIKLLLFLIFRRVLVGRWGVWFNLLPNSCQEWLSLKKTDGRCPWCLVPVLSLAQDLTLMVRCLPGDRAKWSNREQWGKTYQLRQPLSFSSFQS